MDGANGAFWLSSCQTQLRGKSSQLRAFGKDGSTTSCPPDWAAGLFIEHEPEHG